MTIYTDGSSIQRKEGGWGYVIEEDTFYIRACGFELGPHVTNNVMEFNAIKYALMDVYINEYRAFFDDEILIYTDSQYCQLSLSKWIKSWIRRNWVSSSNYPVKNKELIQEIHSIMQEKNARIEWIRGHAGNVLNKEADKLAGYARINKFSTRYFKEK